MENSKLYLKNNNVLARISFKNGQKHTLKIVEDKLDSIETETGEMKEGVKYKVIESGSVKTFFTSSVGLIQRLADVPENTEVVIQMKSKKGKKGFISFFEVSTPNEDIPVINANDTESSFSEQVN